jgi:hypothetical protein
LETINSPFLYLVLYEWVVHVLAVREQGLQIRSRRLNEAFRATQPVDPDTIDDDDDDHGKDQDDLNQYVADPEEELQQSEGAEDAEEEDGSEEEPSEYDTEGQ